MRDIEKYWDAKLVKMRSELNVHQLIKRLDDKASQSDTLVMFEESNLRINECEDALK